MHPKPGQKPGSHLSKPPAKRRPEGSKAVSPGPLHASGQAGTRSPKTRKKSPQPATSPLHPRSLHRAGYDFASLTRAEPALAQKLVLTPDGRQSINFGDAESVFLLNKALLAFHYHIKNWNLPKDNLCPPVPGRADYIHHLADLVAGGKTSKASTPGTPKPGTEPKHKETDAGGTIQRVLDIGTGAGCIYPLLGQRSYGWHFVASDIQQASLDSARVILTANPDLAGCIELRLQKEPRKIFEGIIRPGEWFDLSLCNPPFHASAAEAKAANRERLDKMGLKPRVGQNLNFGGQSAELWCPGGEEVFIRTMIQESTAFAGQVGWFTTLVAKSAHLKGLQAALRKAGARQTRIIPMAQGQKSSRILAWSFSPDGSNPVKAPSLAPARPGRPAPPRVG